MFFSAIIKDHEYNVKERKKVKDNANVKSKLMTISVIIRAWNYNSESMYL